MHYVLVHGSCHGAWCWDQTKKHLEELGHRVSAPELPHTGLDDDVACVAGIVEALAEPVVLVGHSYAGFVISEAAKNQSNIIHLMYVAAVLYEAGESFERLLADVLAGFASEMVVLPDGRVTYAESSRSRFYNECPDDVAAEAVSRLRPMAAPPGKLEISETWRDIATSYVVCNRDRAIPPEAQRAMSRNAQHVIEIEADHSPFLSNPQALLSALVAPTTLEAPSNQGGSHER